MQVQINFHEGAIIGQREEQQDDKTNLIINNEHRLYVLADGMGGQKGGRLASKVVCDSVREYFLKNPQIDNAEADLQLAANHANKALSDVLRNQPELNGMGATLIAVLMNEHTNMFSYISIGDSPLYLFRHGRLMRINANHAYFEELKYLVASGEMTGEEASNHPQRHAITSAVMGKVIEKTDINSGTLQQGELLLLASDGIQVLTETPQGEISQILNTANGNLEQAVNLLLQAVAKKNDPYQDNTTLVLVRAAEAPQPQSAATVPLVNTTQPTLAKPDSSALKRRPGLLYLVVAALVATVIILLLLLLLNNGLLKQDIAETEESTSPATTAAEHAYIDPDTGGDSEVEVKAERSTETETPAADTKENETPQIDLCADLSEKELQQCLKKHNAATDSNGQ